MSYVGNLAFYAATAVGAVGSAAVLYFGVGHEISDLLRIDSDIARVTIDSVVGVTPLLAFGAVGERTKYFCDKPTETCVNEK